MSEMRTGKYSEITIRDRSRVLGVLAQHLDVDLLQATGDHLRAHQAEFAHLRPATVDIYTRHIRAFYDWAERRHLIATNPAGEMTATHAPRGLPHPTPEDDLRLVLACARGMLRMAYVLAAFAGLRCGEICRLHRRDLNLASPNATALIHGKGDKERVVPFLAPVVAELHAHGMGSGWIITHNGRQYRPHALSVESSRYLHSLGLSTTLHSMRGTYLTNVGETTRDPLFARDLAGHSSVKTTEIYMKTSMRDAHLRLAGITEQADRLLGSGEARGPSRPRRTA